MVSQITECDLTQHVAEAVVKVTALRWDTASHCCIPTPLHTAGRYTVCSYMLSASLTIPFIHLLPCLLIYPPFCQEFLTLSALGAYLVFLHWC
ncbi:hypothetical protein FKM82_001728 [Ascaphus truei]